MPSGQYVSIVIGNTCQLHTPTEEQKNPAKATGEMTGHDIRRTQHRILLLYAYL